MHQGAAGGHEMTDKAFEDWWRLLKPAECDEVEEHFRECWQAATLAERERCAKVCETWAKGHAKADGCTYSDCDFVAAAQDCAAAIRALPDGGT